MKLGMHGVKQKILKFIRADVSSIALALQLPNGQSI